MSKIQKGRKKRVKPPEEGIARVKRFTKTVEDTLHDIKEADVVRIKEIIYKPLNEFLENRKPTETPFQYFGRVGKRDLKGSRHYFEWDHENDVYTVDDAKVESEARYRIKQKWDKFVRKLEQKVLPIVGNKDVQRMEFNVSSTQNTVVGEIIFTLKDGTRFIVRQSLVTVWQSKARYPFHRYPTTFHDLTLPDGTVVKRVSQKQVYELLELV
jgi:hypothetical protein